MATRRRKDEPPKPTKVAAIRRFNRFYTRQIGVLGPNVLDTGFSLAEMRVLWEIAHLKGTTASRLQQDLGLDQGYLSRILARFREARLISTNQAVHDGRVRSIELTRAGESAIHFLEEKASEAATRLIEPLSEGQQDRLVAAMASIQSVFEPQPMRVWPYELRDPRPGDYGWVIQRHGALYEAEYKWDETFEALVAEIVAKYIRGRKPERERAWIAERDGAIVGCVFLVAKSAKVAQLRLLLVEPSMRGHGLGKALVGQCIRFARESGYRKIVLWTQSNLTAARRIYQRAGFVKVREDRHRSFGHALTGEYWELAIRPAK
jgi:DNA-binding MarR family transcriptional regulator/N-acetylglutamate synthase-like GNAT family acetyltransferase